LGDGAFLLYAGIRQVLIILKKSFALPGRNVSKNTHFPAKIKRSEIPEDEKRSVPQRLARRSNNKQKERLL